MVINQLCSKTLQKILFLLLFLTFLTPSSLLENDEPPPPPEDDANNPGESDGGTNPGGGNGGGGGQGQGHPPEVKQDPATGTSSPKSLIQVTPKYDLITALMETEKVLNRVQGLIKGLVTDRTDVKCVKDKKDLANELILQQPLTIEKIKDKIYSTNSKDEVERAHVANYQLNRVSELEEFLKFVNSTLTTDEGGGGGGKICFLVDERDLDHQLLGRNRLSCDKSRKMCKLDSGTNGGTTTSEVSIVSSMTFTVVVLAYSFRSK